jgi:dihydroneopterin aldolase
MLTTIFIDQLRVHAPVGWYEEERINKVELEISIKVKFDARIVNDELHQTIDYATLSNWAINHCNQPTKLLESVANNILQQIENEIERGLVHVWICIRKPQIQTKGVIAVAHGIEVEQSYPKSQDN